MTGTPRPFQTLTVRQQGVLLRVVLDRPERHNAIDELLLDEMAAALDRAESTPELRVVSLEATGPVFCSGMDLASAAGPVGPDGPAAGAARGGARFFDLLDRITTLPRVVVAAVDGRVTGGGVGLVAASDVAVATERGSFGLPEALWGLLPCGVLPFLIRRVGAQPARLLTLTTLPVDARRAAAIGLVDELVTDIDGWLRRLAGRLARVDGQTLADGKRYLDRLLPPPHAQRALAVAEFSRLMSTPAARDRIDAFATGRRMPWEPA
ncbi:MAG: enoyl-CoA hydratase/isomerase family protein [Actinobacteria bacterium]|nr:enoyl-CoA hydratase/isomerase family protein [Actinomycetota bacterium]